MKSIKIEDVIGKTILSRGRRKTGIITSVDQAYYPGLGVLPVYVVKWNTGRINKIRTTSVEISENGDFKLL